MRRPWLYFCYQFDASVVNSLTLSIPHVSCHSVFVHDFKLYDDSVCADDLWFSHDIAFLTIPFVGYDSIFSIDSIHELALSFQWWFQVLQWISFRWWFMDQPSHSVFDNSIRPPWLYFCYGFHTWAGTQFLVMISSSIGTVFSLTIYGSAMT